MSDLANDRIHSLVTDNIDVWTNAIKKKSTTGRGVSKKQELIGIKKLRELILELAVRGKLVSQNANDEAASVLIERITKEKEKLVKDKKIKKPRKYPLILDKEKPFTLPPNWEWVRLEDVGHDLGQLKPESEFTYIDVGSINKELGFVEDPSILSESEAPSRARKLVKKGTVIYSTIRPYLLNIAVIDKELSPRPIASTAFAIIHPMDGMSASYIYRYLRSPSFISYVENVQVGVAYPAINDKQFFNGLIPVAPKEEQHRIVAKVDELMALCDQLELQTENSLSAHQTLVEVLLSTLTSSADAKEFQSNWARIAEHFDTLFTTEHAIDQLKQTILQLAVMGKLVPQNPNDEAASKLLERIANEKAQLVGDKKIKKHPDVEPIGDNVALPSSWIPIVVQDFADIRLGSTPSRAEIQYWDGDIPWVSSGEVADSIIYDTKEKITAQGFEKSSLSIIPKRSMLMAIIGQGKTRGQTALLGIDACTNQNVAAFIFNEHYVLPEFVKIWAQSKYDAHRGDGRGGAQPALNGRIVRSFKFPLPPFDEQKRIFAKVNELQTFCNQLKVYINEAQTIQVKIAETLVEQAVK